MKSKHVLPLFLLLVAIPAQAAPRWLTATPRAVGRSAANMVTFKHPWVAAQQWLQVGALIFDEKSTYDAMRRCPFCVESNPATLYHGPRASAQRVVADTFMMWGIETTFTKYLSEIPDDRDTNCHTTETPLARIQTCEEGVEKNKFWRNLYSAFPAETIALHAWGGHHNMSISPDGTINGRPAQ